MNKIQQRRSRLIDKIVATIRKSKDEGKELDRKKFVNMIMGDSCVARRTAIEYMDSAFARIESGGLDG